MYACLPDILHVTSLGSMLMCVCDRKCVAMCGVPGRAVLHGRRADGADRAVQPGVLLLGGIGAPERVGV